MDETNVQKQISTGSDSNHEDSNKNETVPLPLDKRICLVGKVMEDPAACRAAQSFRIPIITSETGIEFIHDTSCTTVFILDDFDHPNFKQLSKSPHRILGSIALQQIAEKKEKLPNNTRPLYNMSMAGVVVCFTGFRKKEDLTRLIPLIHHMGGSIRKDMVAKVTHLIANSCGGEKYQYANTFKVPIMSQTWVEALWEERNNLQSVATKEDLIAAHKLKPFYGAKICFHGFSEDETKHMHEVLEANGGQVTDLNDPHCTHIVIENWEQFNILSPTPKKSYETNTNTNTYLAPLEEKQTTTTYNENLITEPPIHSFEPVESPQKRRLSPDNSDIFDTSFKRRRNSSIISINTPRLKEILKTPIDYITRRKSVSSTVTSNLNDSTASTMTCIDMLNQSTTSLNFASTPVRANQTMIDLSSKDKFDQFKSPSRLFATPKSKSFRKGFKKTLKLMESKSNLKNIVEQDPNCSIDDVDISIYESVKNHKFMNRQVNECSFISVTSGIETYEEFPAQKNKMNLNSTINIPVVDESTVTERPDGSPKALLVKAEWFWASVQNVACVDEKEYLFEDYLECVVSPGRRDSHAATPSSSSRRKRKRLQDTLSQLVRTNDSPSLHKRRSSVSDAGLLSVSGSFLDCTASPNKDLLDQAEGPTVETPRKNLSPRQQVFMELVQTESNYVNILHTIMTMFKSHLEDMPESEALLNNTELKIIFGNVPPIYELHSRMLEELRYASAHWSEDTSIGNIILRYSQDLLKAYPPFVNFFETMKEMLTQCDQTKPRFHAFLKVCQTRPECGRQGLQDLLIRPVQRLPSIMLLLNDILKHTNKNNADHGALEKALAAIKEVMTHINEDKRKTEGQKVMFDIFNEIHDCPPDLVSSHRSFISRCEVTELSDGLSGRGNPLVLFLFSDQLEVCKKRSKAFNSLKSPNSVNGFHKSNSKPYKHVMMMALNTIKRVIDIHETEECQRVFALVFRDNQELKERLFSFTMTEEDADKTAFLRTLCRQIANNACTADADKFLAFLEPSQLDIDTSDVNVGTLSKAFKFATRTRIKVGRAFSFNKTPSKLKRAMSTMMSPFGSSTNITPASQLANMKLASCHNINELGSGTDGTNASSNDGLSAPRSVQPQRKLKCSSLSVTALKRL